jgi:hypothetical protein
VKNYIEFGNLLANSSLIDDSRYKTTAKKYSETHIFEIDKTVSRMLMLTDQPPLDELPKLPFNSVFVDFSITKKELNGLGFEFVGDRIVGILCSYVLDTSESILKLIEFTIMIIKDDKFIPLVFLDYNSEFKEEIININVFAKEHFGKEFSRLDRRKYSYKSNKFTKCLRNLVMNSLFLVNDPLVKVIELQHSNSSNQRRLEKGKIPIPNRSIIRLTGELKVYADKIEKSGALDNGFNYRFWVRGHWMNFRAERYVNMKGKKTWVPPYIKGEGPLIEKRYDMKLSDDSLNRIIN